MAFRPFLSFSHSHTRPCNSSLSSPHPSSAPTQTPPTPPLLPTPPAPYPIARARLPLLAHRAPLALNRLFPELHLLGKEASAAEKEEVGTAAAPLNNPSSYSTLHPNPRIVPRHLQGELHGFLLEYMAAVTVAVFMRCSSFVLCAFTFVVWVCVALLVVLGLSLDIRLDLPIPILALLPLYPPPRKR
ncbi:hypothetical protein CVT25_007693 [Psilocybe cyanescens]|uniref:Uncharacterized protein n=1 Tax=Psilocybe cyanescens TaxID=93625 RepID=A0A409X1A7_PSICY|nr:hypothetical protein CVT25_007693 [Psilocybe cyanescens]